MAEPSAGSSESGGVVTAFVNDVSAVVGWIFIGKKERRY
jgi:hypothetical protein